MQSDTRTQGHHRRTQSDAHPRKELRKAYGNMTSIMIYLDVFW